MPFDGSGLIEGRKAWSSAPARGWKPLLAWLRNASPEGREGRYARMPSPGRPGGEITPIQLLRAARSLIEAEQAWTQGSFQGPGGTRCAIGALYAAAAQAGWRAYPAKRRAHALLRAVAQERGFPDVATMNDVSDHGQVLSAFDAAGGRTARR